MTNTPTPDTPMTLAEAEEAGIVIPPKDRMVPQGETHMALGRDPATMEFEVRPSDDDPVAVDPAADTVSDGAPVEGTDDPNEAALVAQTVATIEADGEDPDGLAELIELSESDDGKWLLLPVGDHHQFRVAKRLPHRRLQRLIKQVRQQKAMQDQAKGDLMTLSDEQLDELLNTTVGILEIIMDPAEAERFEAGLDDLADPIDTAGMGDALRVVLPRYMRGVGGAKGKPQGSSPTPSPSPTT